MNTSNGLKRKFSQSEEPSNSQGVKFSERVDIMDISDDNARDSFPESEHDDDDDSFEECVQCMHSDFLECSESERSEIEVKLDKWIKNYNKEEDSPVLEFYIDNGNIQFNAFLVNKLLESRKISEMKAKTVLEHTMSHRRLGWSDWYRKIEMKNNKLINWQTKEPHGLLDNPCLVDFNEEDDEEDEKEEKEEKLDVNNNYDRDNKKADVKKENDDADEKKEDGNEYNGGLNGDEKKNKDGEDKDDKMKELPPKMPMLY